MCKKIFLIAIAFFLSFPSLSMQRDGAKSAFEIINLHLLTYTNLYDFKETDQRFWGELGAAARWQEIVVRKHKFISDNVLHCIDDGIQQIREKNAVNVGPYHIDKESTKSVLSGIVFKDAGSNLLQYLVVVLKTTAEYYLSNARFEDIERDLVRTKKEILHALANDPFKEQEREVVHNWDKLLPGTRKVASTLLLELRREQGKNLVACKEHLKHLVSFPTEFKLLPPDFTKETGDYGGTEGALNKFVEKIFTDSDLKMYSDETKRHLKNGIKEICKHSQLAHTLGGTKEIKGKQVFLFYGESGTGKSHAANEIVKQLDLPHLEIRAMREDDFGYGKLSGNSDYLDGKLGTMFKAFFITDTQGKCWKNPVIIINEVDRMMGKYNNNLKPLMDIFDELIKEFFSSYFGTDMDISGIIWILTANTDFGLSDSKDLIPGQFNNGKDPLAALRDRMKIIHFDHIPPKQIENFLENFITTQKLFELSTRYSPSQSETMKKKLVPFIVGNFPHCSIRLVEKQAKILSEVPEDQWPNYAIQKLDIPKKKTQELEQLEKQEKFIKGNIESTQVALQKFGDNPNLITKIKKMKNDLRALQEKREVLEKK